MHTIIEVYHKNDDIKTPHGHFRLYQCPLYIVTDIELTMPGIQVCELYYYRYGTPLSQVNTGKYVHMETIDATFKK